MSNRDVRDRRAKLESLARAVARHGRDTFEVSLWFNEFTVERRHGSGRMCTVMLLSDEPMFQAHFDFGAVPALSSFTFNIGAADSALTAPAAKLRFSNGDEAGEWLLKFLETPTRAAGQ